MCNVNCKSIYCRHLYDGGKLVRTNADSSSFLFLSAFLLFHACAAVVLCDHPSMPPYAQMSGERRTVGSVIRYSCMGQRAIVGNTTRVCQPTGQWSGSPPHCTGNSLCLLTNTSPLGHLNFRSIISPENCL